MMHTLDVAWKSAQVLGGGRGYDAAGSRRWRAWGGLALYQWVLAVNAKGGFGMWCWDVALRPEQVWDVLMKHGNEG